MNFEKCWIEEKSLLTPLRQNGAMQLQPCLFVAASCWGAECNMYGMLTAKPENNVQTEYEYVSYLMTQRKELVLHIECGHEEF